jgi:diacylglycerol O-acyltransferase / wax synthase
MTGAQGHMDRLTSLDASFLTNETGPSHMHIGAVVIFEGPPPKYEELVEHIESRLHLVPRYRQKLAIPPVETGRPFWVDDPSFNPTYHVRHAALPAPGDEAQLRRRVARVFSQRLDRSKPLWELWLVQGLEGKRFALISKTHHALVDGVSGVDIATVLFDFKPTTEPPTSEHRWHPQPEPTGTELAAKGVEGLAKTPLRLARRLESAVRHPNTTLSEARDALEGVTDVAGALANPAPSVPLNTRIGSHRRFVWQRARLDDFKEIKRELGGTVNDVVLSVVSGALRSWLQTRGVSTDSLELRALVPISIRAADHQGELGNQIAAMRGPLPVSYEDPVARLEAVCDGMHHVKSSKQAVGAEVISRFNDFAPPTLLAQASRLNFSTRLFNLIVTNIPGPQFPLYLLGRRLLDIFPIAFLPQDHALAIAIMSYDGGINFGLLADHDSMDDVGAIGLAIGAEIDGLLERARSARAEAASRPPAHEAEAEQDSEEPASAG